jgi:hypothetical protein
MPNFEIAEHVSLKSGSQIINLRAGIDSGAALIAVIKYVSASNDYKFYNGEDWVSMSGFKSEALDADAVGLVSTLNGLKPDKTAYQFRSIKAGSDKITIAKNASNQIEIDLGTVPISAITGLQTALDGKANSVHTHATSDVTALTNYIIGTVGSYLAPTDTLNVALGKLEYRIKNQFVSSIDFDSTTQKITFKNLAGVELGNIDLVLESVIQGIDYNSTTKTLTFTLVNGNTTDIPLTDLIDIYTGVDGSEITVSITDNAISAVLKDGTIALTKLSDITLGTITASSTEVVTTATSLLTILKTFAKNIKYLFTNKADESRTIAAPSASATQNAAGTANLSTVLKKLIDNVAHLFSNKADNKQTVTAPTASNTQQGAGSVTIVSILQTLMNNVKYLFDNKADNSQTMTAPDNTDGTQITAGSKTIINILQKLANNIAYLFTNKANNKQTVGTTTASETQVGTGELSLLSILQTYAKNIKALLTWKTNIGLQKIYVSSPITGASGTITLATHGVTNPKVVTATLAGANMIIYTKIDPTTKSISWTSQTNFIAGDNAIITIIG